MVSLKAMMKEHVKFDDRMSDIGKHLQNVSEQKRSKRPTCIWFPDLDYNRVYIMEKCYVIFIKI